MSVRPPVRVVVVEDSATARALLVAILRSDPDIDVVGEATNGRDAVELAVRLRPAMIVMDIEMPVMDGLEATKRIMVEAPTPIIIVSARHDTRNVEVSLRALRVGALAVLAKPAGPATAAHGPDAARLVSLVKALSEVTVLRRRWQPDTVSGRHPEPAVTDQAWKGTIRAIGVAASTGGPAALYRFLELLPADMAAPVLVVQHIVEGFTAGLVSWLGSGTALPVTVAAHGEPLQAGVVYVAPDGRHIEVGPDATVALSGASPVQGFRPSATPLFASLGRRYGRSAAGVVLTGMGTDGLAGIQVLHQSGGLVLAQDEQTSAVFGMPGAVIGQKLAHRVGSVEDLASSVLRFVPKRRL